MRVFNLYGPGQPKEYLLSRITNQVRNENIIKVDNLSPKRDYVYIDDLCSAIVKAINYKGNQHIFNIGSGKSEFINFISKLGFYYVSSDVIISNLYKDFKTRSMILQKLKVQ